MLDSTISWFKVCVVQSICANTIITLYLNLKKKNLHGCCATVQAIA